METFLIEHLSVLFGLLCKHAEKERGEQGLAAMEEATRRYGMERGHRMALRAMSNGDPLTMEMYLAYSELDMSADPAKQDFRVTGTSPVYENEIHKCPWHDARAKHGLDRYCAQYCPFIDYYLVKGFNPGLSMECVQTIGGGAPYCVHRWNGFDATPEQLAHLQEKQKELGKTCKKDFLYHTAHTYFSAGNTLTQLLGADCSKRILAGSLEDFARLFGQKAADCVLTFADTDFSNI